LEAGIGYIEEVDEQGLLVISQEGKRHAEGVWLTKCKMLTHTPNSNTGGLEGRQCVYLSFDGNNFCLGVFTREEFAEESNLNLAEHEHLLWAGERRVLRTYPDGSIGIYSVLDQDEGFEFNRLVEYSGKKNSLYVGVSELAIGILGASNKGNIAIQMDESGVISYIHEGKLHLDDTVSRFKLRFSNPIKPSPGGILPDGVMELSIDNRRLERAITPATPLDLIKIKAGPLADTLNGVEMTVGMMCKIMVGLKTSAPNQLVKIETKAGTSLAIGSNGSVEIVTAVGAKITVSPEGGVEVLAKTKASIKAPLIELDGVVDIKTAPGTPGFQQMGKCPLNGAILTGPRAGVPVG